MQKVISSSPSLGGTVKKNKREQMKEGYNSSRGRKKTERKGREGYRGKKVVKWKKQQ